MTTGAGGRRGGCHRPGSAAMLVDLERSSCLLECLLLPQLCRQVKAACSYYLDENRMQRLTPVAGGGRGSCSDTREQEKTSLVSTSTGRLLLSEVSDSAAAADGEQMRTRSWLPSIITTPPSPSSSCPGDWKEPHEISQAQEVVETKREEAELTTTQRERELEEELEQDEPSEDEEYNPVRGG
eukprot:230364-Hanusia_phi.AAC.1